VQAGDALDDGEPEPRAARVGTRGVESVEGAPDRLQLGIGNARAAVQHRDRQRVAHPRGAQRDLPATIGGGVFQQVENGAPQRVCP
jgi:hypothetical protein